MNIRDILTELKRRKDEVDRAIRIFESISTGHKRRGRPPKTFSERTGKGSLNKHRTLNPIVQNRNDESKPNGNQSSEETI